MSDSVSSPTLAVPTSRCSFRKVAWIAGATLALFLAAIVIAPHFVDLGFFKSTYLPLVEEALNRRVDVTGVRLRLVPTPSIQLSRLRVFDNPPFATNTFFSAEQVRLRLKLLPLLRGHFDITELVLDKPVFNLLKQPDGTFNYSDIASKKTSAANRRDSRKRGELTRPAEVAVLPVLLPRNVSVKGGRFNLVTPGQNALVFSGIDLSVREFSSDMPFPFRASLSYPGLNTVSLEGKLNYREDKSLLELKDNRLKIHELSFPVAGAVANPFTAPRINLNLRGNKVDAKAIFQILTAFALASRDTEITGPMDLAISLTGPSNSLLAQAVGSLKDVKVDSKRAMKGTVSGEITVRLPFTGGPVSRRVQGGGKLAARDGELTNVNLVKRIERVTGMIGLSENERRQATTFQTMEADFILRGGYAEFTRLYLVNPQMEVTGAGTMTLDQPTLDLAISTALSPQASARAGRGRVSSFFKDKQGRIVVPLRINGPVENPSVNLNAEKLAETGVPENVEKGFSAFFRRLFRR